MQFSYLVSDVLIRCVAYSLNVETNGAVFPTLIKIFNISILGSTHLPSEMQERSHLANVFIWRDFRSGTIILEQPVPNSDGVLD